MTVKHSERRIPRPMTVLLVEDDAAVRLSTAMGLITHDINVLEARNGEEGLAICREYADAIDAVIADVAMPLMWGHEFARELALFCPDLPVVLMSGFPEEFLIDRGGLTGPEPFLVKPFKAREMIALLEALLGWPPSAAVSPGESNSGLSNSVL